MLALTPNEQRVLAEARRALPGRGSVTASYIAFHAGLTTRQASGTLSSLDRKGALRAIPDGFIGRTFYVLPEDAS